PGQGLQRVVMAHPLLLFLSRAILTVDVAHVVAVVAVGLAFEEGWTFAPTRALDEAAHRGIDGLHVLAIDALRVDAECLRPGEDLAGDGFAARRVLAVEVVLAHVDHRQLPERGHVHGLVDETLAERTVAEEAHRDLPALSHL